MASGARAVSRRGSRVLEGANRATRGIDWRRELEARLHEDEELEPKKSRFSTAAAYFYRGKEIAHFHLDAELDIRLGKDSMLRHKLQTDPRVKVLNPKSDWVAFGFQSEEDLQFLLGMIARAKKTVRAG